MKKVLTKRQKILLRGIVQQFIETALPVGSDFLVKNCRVECSPATVRNEMLTLDELGYLQKTHASSGRIPTDEGYRFYVDCLMKCEPVSCVEVNHIRNGIQKANGNAFLILEEVTVLLSKISRELAIVMTPQISDSVFDRLELVELSRNKVLAVIHVCSRMVKTVVMEIQMELKSGDLENTCRLLNERLSGLTLEEIKRNIRSRMNNLMTEKGDLLRLLVESASSLFDFTGPIEIHTAGSQNIISQPEFSNKGMIEMMFTFLDDRKGLAKMVHAISDDPSVAIGHENLDDRLKSFSIVTSFYRLGRDMGVVGVIGPTRMRYQKIVPLVNRIAGTMTEFLS